MAEVSVGSKPDLQELRAAVKLSAPPEEKCVLWVAESSWGFDRPSRVVGFDRLYSVKPDLEFW